jgi:septal ring factor EnvC (AmiA/AmiB activator)
MSKGGDQVAVVTHGPWLGRDGFVAETAVRLDKVEGAIAHLEREAEKAQRVADELAEEVARVRRFESFEESLRNSRDYKFKENQKAFRDLKARLDAIEGKKSTFVGLTYKSFESIDKKLSELSALKGRVEKSNRNMLLCAVLFCAAFVFAGATAAYHLF